MEENKELDFDVEIDDENYDAVIILKNPFEDTGLGLVSGYSGTLEAKKAIKYYKRIFQIDGDEDIQDRLTEFLAGEAKDSAEQQEVSFQKFAEIVVTDVISALEKDCMMEIFPFYSRDRDEIYVKIRISEKNYKIQADLDDYYLQFKKEPSDTEPFQVISPFAPYEMEKPKRFVFFGKAPNDYYQQYDDFDTATESGSLFQYKDKVRLLYSNICTNLDIGLLTSLGILHQYLPFHREQQLQNLTVIWGTFKHPFTRQNLPLIRSYFGEKIAMYFGWLEFLMQWMLIPGLVGLVLGVLDLVLDNTNDDEDEYSGGEIIAIFTAFSLPFFAVFYEQMWIRQENKYAWRWGTSKLHEVEDQRPEFKGVYEKDKITGKHKKMRQSSEWYKVKKTLSLSVALLFVMLVLTTVIALFLYRATLSKAGSGPTIVGIINALQIKVFNFLYKYVAVWMNNKENYEFPSQYNDGLTVKLFLFQFVNSYTSLYYIAFAKGTIEGCSDDNCIFELKVQLASIFITNFCLNALELLTPILINKLKTYCEQKKLKKLNASGQTYRTRLSYSEAQGKLSVYGTPINDYMEVVISLGYVVIFSASFPITATLFLLLLFVELRVDAFKLTRLTQRPFPYYTNTIGVWLYIVKFLVVISTMTNIGLIIFTTNVFELDSTHSKWLLFIILEHGIILGKYLIAFAIPDVPLRVQDGLKWSQRIVNERLYGKLCDADRAKQLKELELEPIRRSAFDGDYKKITFSDAPRKDS